MSSDSIGTSRRRVEIQSMSEMTQYFTMTKCNKLFITYLTRSTERLPYIYIYTVLCVHCITYYVHITCVCTVLHTMYILHACALYNILCT